MVALHLGLVAEEKLPGVGLAHQPVQAVGQDVADILGAADFAAFLGGPGAEADKLGVNRLDLRVCATKTRRLTGSRSLRGVRPLK
jgi:hypothetical protein